MDQATFDSVTPREREVLTAFARLARVGDVAADLKRSPHTVNNQLKSARLKLGVTDSLTAARLFVAAQASQDLASPSLAIAPSSAVAPPERQDKAIQLSPAADVVKEERAVFDHQLPETHHSPPAVGKRDGDDLTTQRAVLAPKLQMMLTLAVLVLALLALAPYAGRAVQGLANLTQPPI